MAAVKNNKFFAVFLLVFFFAMFSIGTFLLQNTAETILDIVLNPHFLVRVATVVLGMILFFFVAKHEFFKSQKFFFSLLGVCYFIAFIALFFSRDGNPKFFGEELPIGQLLGISSILFVTSAIDDNRITSEDVLVFSFIIVSSVSILFLTTDFAFSIIVLLTLSLLSFAYGFSFGLKVSLLSFLLIVALLFVFFLSPTLMTKYFTGLSMNDSFMHFLTRNNTMLSMSGSLDIKIFEYSQGEMIFALIQRFGIWGVIVLTLLLAAMVVLGFSSASSLRSRSVPYVSYRVYGLSVFLSLSVIMPLLSLITSLPIFKADFPFVTVSNIGIFMTILTFAYIADPIFERTVEEEEEETLEN